MLYYFHSKVVFTIATTLQIDTMQHIKGILDTVLYQAAQRRAAYLEHIEQLLGSDMLSNSERQEYQTIRNYLATK